MSADDLAAAIVGSWSLIAYSRRQHGTIIWPFGEDAQGYLQYGADGRVSATLARRQRPAFATAPAADWRGDAIAWAEAAMSYVAYTGRYAVDGARVSHLVDLSLYPNWTGTTLLRWASLEGTGAEQQLRLETAPPGAHPPDLLVSSLLWRRA